MWADYIAYGTHYWGWKLFKTLQTSTFWPGSFWPQRERWWGDAKFASLRSYSTVKYWGIRFLAISMTKYSIQMKFSKSFVWPIGIEIAPFCSKRRRSVCIPRSLPLLSAEERPSQLHSGLVCYEKIHSLSYKTEDDVDLSIWFAQESGFEQPKIAELGRSVFIFNLTDGVSGFGTTLYNPSTNQNLRCSLVHKSRV